MGEPEPTPLTEKDMLAATVKATAGLVKRTAEVERIQAAISTEIRKTEAQEAASTIGETTPEAET